MANEETVLSNLGHKVVLLATLDSKGEEAAHLKSLLVERSRRCVCVVDVGTSGLPAFPADVSRECVSRSGGGLSSASGPADAMDVMASGAARIVRAMFDKGEISAIAGIGGGKGAGVFHRATKDLPYGFPKLLVTSGRPALLAEIATTTDTILLPTLVDLFGMNQFTRATLGNAADMLAGLAWKGVEERTGKTVAITAFGVTTPAVQTIKSSLESAGITVVAFPANGAGGRTMESLIAKGTFDGVIDLTTTEMADLHLGGTASAGEGRLTAASRVGIPQVIAPGATDMVNFGAPDTVPPNFADRVKFQHTPMTTLVRTIPEDTAEIARQTAERLNEATGPVVVLWPGGGVSDYDRPGQAFHDPSANTAWRDSMKETLVPSIPVTETVHHINDPEFAALCSDWMIAQMEARP
ncbi:MAG: Tm-1-like ATP-binding domain-containing protein [Boseongicola sp.]|nr:Tm-1-like ATP-binding domain-containing protein [Boseongicola sp.]